MIRYWQTNTTTQIGGSFQQVFCYEVPAVTPAAGSYMVLGRDSRVDVRAFGENVFSGFQWRSQITTEEAEVVLMAMGRRTFRGVFAGVFRGVN